VLVSTHSADIGLVRVDSTHERVEDPKSPGDSQRVLEARAAAVLEGDQGAAGYTGTIGNLCGC
jgi:hypothetical protein